MKHIYNILCAIFIITCVASCNSKGTKFAPKGRESSMTEQERARAINNRKAELNVDITSMMYSNGVKLTVLPPTPKGEITEAISERIGAKMLNIIAVNGIGGVNNVPDFALTASISEIGREATGTAPQKYIIKYELNYKVFNFADGNVYGATSEEISGVGSSFTEAARNAVNEIKSTDALQSMLATAEQRIIKWYEDNLPTVKNQVDAAISAKNYPLAMAYLNSVPSQAAAAYEYASKRYSEVLNDYKTNMAAAEFAAIKGAIAKGLQSSELNDEVYVHLALLPIDTPQYKEAMALTTSYETKVLEVQAKMREIAFSREEAERIHREKMELGQQQADKEIALVQAKASEQALVRQMREEDQYYRGFWGNLGARIISGLDFVGDKVSGIGEKVENTNEQNTKK